MFAGIYWIITAPSVDLVIRSTVSIMFVQNVDEIIFESCSSEDIKKGVQATSFRLVRWSSMIGASRQASDKLNNAYRLYFHLPLLAVASFSIVTSVRGLDNMGCMLDPLSGIGMQDTFGSQICGLKCTNLARSEAEI